MKVGGWDGNGTANMLFLNHSVELWTLASFLPIPVVLFFPHLDPPPWGLHEKGKKKSVFFISCPATMKSLGEELGDELKVCSFGVCSTEGPSFLLLPVIWAQKSPHTSCVG